MSEAVTMHTDGACRGNPGPGGWGVLLEWGGHRRELSGAEPHTTNNRMEMIAAIRGLEALRRPCRVALYTDSRYVQQGITSWLANWRRRNWRTADGSPVKNAELWRELDAQASRHDVSWHWVKGHAGVAGNEAADALARAAIDRLLGSA